MLASPACFAPACPGRGDGLQPGNDRQGCQEGGVAAQGRPLRDIADAMCAESPTRAVRAS